MLVSAEEMLKKAKAGKYAVGQFNFPVHLRPSGSHFPFP